jgi:hypothetical protein
VGIRLLSEHMRCLSIHGDGCLREASAPGGPCLPDCSGEECALRDPYSDDHRINAAFSYFWVKVGLQLSPRNSTPTVLKYWCLVQGTSQVLRLTTGFTYKVPSLSTQPEVPWSGAKYSLEVLHLSSTPHFGTAQSTASQSRELHNYSV